MKWRWYHFYVLLAVFDLLVIASSVLLLHRTIGAYQVALSRWGTIDTRQRWVADLRLALLDLNAPGNDVFESRDPVRERRRFEQKQNHLRLLIRREPEFGVNLSSFRTHLDRMIEHEQRIFVRFESLGSDASNVDANDERFASASASMAAMDRAQAAAVHELSLIEKDLLQETRGLLHEHDQTLTRMAKIEKYVAACILIALLGAFWFVRKLQLAYDQMVEDQRRVERERGERLAAVGEVCSAVAHGIRNPLAAISSSAQLALRFGTLDEATRLRVNDVLSESQRLDKRISRLLNFSKVSSQPLEPFELKPVIDQAVHEVKPRLDERGLRVEVSVPAEPLVIHGHRERMVQSIIELLSNAMEHMTGSGCVRVSGRREGGPKPHAIIDVIDEGTGIPERIRERVFDLFFTSKAEGHGIGLASVKRSVEFHGGEIRVVPRTEHGAHFEIKLPLA